MAFEFPILEKIRKASGKRGSAMADIFLTDAGEKGNLITECQASLSATDAAWLKPWRNIECKRSWPVLSLRLCQDRTL